LDAWQLCVGVLRFVRRDEDALVEQGSVNLRRIVLLDVLLDFE
jgi:hypothetical protein